MLRKYILTFALIVLLVTPALPASAGSATGPGLLHWLPGWLQGALSWVTGEQGPSLGAAGFAGSSHDEEPTIDLDGFGSGDAGPKIDPHGLQECTDDSSTSSSGDQGPCIDPGG